MGRLIDIGDTCLHVEERGHGELAVIALHGGPGLDHTEFGWWLDPLADDHRLVLVDQRSQGRSLPSPPETWTLERYAADVEALAGALGLERYVVLGHSFGAFVALRHAIDFPGRPAGTIVSAGVPSARWLEGVEHELETFEPADLRAQVRSAWAREADAATQEDVRSLLFDQLPFHFADPRSPRIEDVRIAMVGAVYAPDVLRSAAAAGTYGGLDVEDRLGAISHPLLVISGRHDRITPPGAGEAIAAGVPGAELVVLEDSAHMAFIEQPGEYLEAVGAFLSRIG
jgi:proline iminopeptidase